MTGRMPKVYDPATRSWVYPVYQADFATTLGGHARFSEGDLEAIKATVIEAARVAPDDAEVSS